MATFDYLLVRWKRVPTATAGAVGAVSKAADAIKRRDPEEATRMERRSRELAATEEASEFDLNYIVDRTFPLPLAPTAVSYQDSPATSIRFTQTGSAIQRSPTRRVDISIQGETGLRYRLGFDSDGIPAYQPGYELHKELGKFLADFWAAPDRGEDVRLTWHDFAHGRQYWVEPVDKTDTWNGEHPVAPGFTINLVAYAKSGYPNAGLGFVLSILPQARDKLRIADRWINSVAAAAAIAETGLEQVNTLVHGLTDLLDAIPRAINATTAMLADANAIERFPFEFWRDIASSTEAAISNLNDTVADFDLLSSGKAEAIVTYRQELRDLQRACEFAALAQQVAAAYSPETTPQTVYTVAAGDTLQKIAARFLGDAGRWTEIATLNGLSAPYVSLSGMPGTAGPGSKILLPAGAQLAELQGAAAVTDDADLYGVDFAIADKRMPLEPGSFPADVQSVSGVACVRQGLQITFGTVQGDDVARPWFGVPATVGDPSYDSAGLVLAQLVDQVTIDDRIAAVRNEKITESAGTLAASFDVHLKSGKRLTSIQSTIGGGAA